MKNLKTIIFPAVFIVLLLAQACIEDGYTNSPSDQISFSTDTLDMGVIFTDEPSPTSRFMVYNQHSKSISVSDIHLAGPDANRFRINVDGISGQTFSNVDIRSKDSIFVFVEATLPTNGNPTPAVADARVEFTTNGILSSVAIKATGQDVTRLKALTITEDMVLTPTQPYVVFDSITIAPQATLTIEPGTQLLFHDKAMLIVRGNLNAAGTAEQPVEMYGDRTGNVVSDISFDIMSRQWTGILFAPESKGTFEYADIRNTVQGIVAVDADLTFVNSLVRNSAMLDLEAYDCNVYAEGSQFSEAGGGLVYLEGGVSDFRNCTFANYYLFSALSGAAIQFAHLSDDPDKGLDNGSGAPYTKALFANCIVYGNGTDLSHGDLSGTDVTFDTCLLKSQGSDDDNFLNCLWDQDPLYYTVREDYYFNYRVKPDSPVIGAASPNYKLETTQDFYGRTRNNDIGAFVFSTEDAEDVQL